MPYKSLNLVVNFPLCEFQMALPMCHHTQTITNAICFSWANELKPAGSQYTLWSSMSRILKMNKNQIKGNIKEIAGKVEKEIGKVIGNVLYQVNGAILGTKGLAQKHHGDTESAMKRVQREIDAENKKHV
jgi:uncharacterized protein YjbJ (UPF0337 family)